jgi:hypothetical protein
MRTILLTALLLLSAPGSGACAEPPISDSSRPSVLTLRFAAGPGWGRTTDNGLRVYDDYALVPRIYDHDGGPAFHLDIDYRLTGDLAVGACVTTWSRSADENPATAHFDQTLVAVTATWYPWRGYIFTRFGYGLGIARLEYLERGIAAIRHDTGAGYLLGLGYIIRLGDTISLAPQITTVGYGTGSLEVWASLTTLTLALTIDLWE